ncbi:MAG: hypothetical protein IPM71_01325 [Bacteroidota bacterium]|nr:MAG: hypothetical protein IPM71_01325 [Bacteroidota bacterium]
MATNTNVQKKKKRSFISGSPDPAGTPPDKEQFLNETNILVKNQKKEESKVADQEKQIQALQQELQRKAISGELKEKRQKRYQSRKTLTTIEETQIPEKYLDEGETRASILHALNEEFNIYCRKNKIRANAQLSLLVYNFLKEKGHLD